MSTAAPAIALTAPARGRTAAVFPAVILLLFAALAVGAPLLAPADPARQSLLARLRPPGASVGGTTHWFGTDELGRDLLSRVLFGARVSLLVAFLSVCVSGSLGALFGMVAGFRRGVAEILIMRGVDMMLSIPPILLAIITVAVLGPGLPNLILVLSLTRWPRYTRVAYGQTLGVVTLPFITASRIGGARSARLLFHHVLPNILPALIVIATLEFGLMVLFEAGLSFLGLGIQPPMPSWGAIMAVGRNYIASAWWIATLPGLCLFLLVLTVNLLGDQLRDRLDPRSAVS